MNIIVLPLNDCKDMLHMKVVVLGADFRFSPVNYWVSWLLNIAGEYLFAWGNMDSLHTVITARKKLQHFIIDDLS